MQIELKNKKELTFEGSLVGALQLKLERPSGALEDDVLGEDVRVRRQTQLKRPATQKVINFLKKKVCGREFSSRHSILRARMRDRTRGMTKRERYRDARINFKIIRIAASHSPPHMPDGTSPAAAADRVSDTALKI
jgi:hypothetical protein